MDLIEIPCNLSLTLIEKPGNIGLALIKTPGNLGLANYFKLQFYDVELKYSCIVLLDSCVDY